MVNFKKKTLTAEPGTIFLDMKIYMEPDEVFKGGVDGEDISRLDDMVSGRLKKKVGSNYDGPAVKRVSLNRKRGQKGSRDPGILIVKYKYKEPRLARREMELLERDVETMEEFRDAVTVSATKIDVRESQG